VLLSKVGFYLTENVRPGWRILPGTNTPAYLASLSVSEKTVFSTPGVKVTDEGAN
jgi:hypothetical protein